MSFDSPLPWVLGPSEVVRLGLGRPALRGSAFVPLRRGVRAIAGSASGTGDERIAAVASQLPAHAVIGGWSAARIYELAACRDDLVVFDGSPEWEERRARAARRSLATMADAPEFARVLVVADPASRMRFRGDTRVLRSVVPPEERAQMGHLAVTTPVRTAFDLVRLLPMRAAVVGLDRLLHLGLTSAAEVARLVRQRAGWLGIAEARRAIDAADGGAESPRETILRLVWLEAGLPRPTCNAVVRDTSGAFAARVDMIDPAVGLVGEYDGSWHSGSERRSDDARREELLEGLGLVVVRATASDIGPAGEAALRARLVRGHRRASMSPLRRWQVTAT